MTEPGEVVDIVIQPPSSPSPPPSPASISPSPGFSSYHSQTHSNPVSYEGPPTPTGLGLGSYGSVQNAQIIGHSNPVSSSANSSSQAISSDHCYGLPYQDHNYGSAISPALGIRVSHTRGNHHHHVPTTTTTTNHLPRAKITVKATAATFPSLAGPPPLERNSCSDEENVVDPLLYTQAADPTNSTATFLSPFLSSVAAGGYHQSSGVTVMPAGGITVCSTSALTTRPRIRRVVLEDSSHTYASAAVGVDGTGQQVTVGKPKHITILAAGSAGANSHPQKVAVFRRGLGNFADSSTIQINTSMVANNPPNLVSTSSTGAPTFSGAILGPGLMAPVIAISGGGEPIPPPKRPGRPRGARVGGQQQQQQQQQRSPRQPKRKKSRPSDPNATESIPTHPPLTVAATELVGFLPPAAAHESVVPASLARLLPSNVATCGIGEVDQSIESVLQTVSSADCIENILNQHQQIQPQAQEHVSVVNNNNNAQKKPNGDTDFQETYKSLYERLFKQLGVPEDEDIDLDKPVGASRQREPYVRILPKKQTSSPGFSAANAGGQSSSSSNKSTGDNTNTQQRNLTDSNSPKSAGASNTDTDESSDDEWAGQDYTTRCICGMTHNDDFMIQCDRCECWQHCDCLGLQKRNVPEKYLCDLCDPRPMKLTKEESQKLQMKKLQKLKRQKAGRKRLSSSTGSVGRGRPRKNTLDSSSSTSAKPQRKTKQQQQQEQADEDLYATFLHMEVNEYTNEVMKAIRLCGDSIGADALEQLPDPPPCLVMYVTKERRGLVANKTIPPDQPVIEIRGKIATTTEFNGRDKTGRLFPCVLFYRGLPKGGGVDGSSSLDLCIDARYRGTEARFVRRSCQANTQVKHVIKNDQLHLLLVATEVIESATELTIPFDYDYRQCNYAIECACKIWGNGECPVDRYNSMRNKKSALLSVASASSASSSAPKRRISVKKRSVSVSEPKKMKKLSKFVKKSVGFKVKLKDKSENLRKFGKKKLKPVASADLTRRRRSTSTSASASAVTEAEDPPPPPSAPADVKPKKESAADESDVSLSNFSSPTSISRQISSFSLGDDSSPTASASSSAAADSHLLSREEKKMQHLVEQIARMEEREKKKVEKRSAKVKDEEKIKKEGFFEAKSECGPTEEKIKKKRGRRPSNASVTSRGRTDSQCSDILTYNPNLEILEVSEVEPASLQPIPDVQSEPILNSSIPTSPKREISAEIVQNQRKSATVDVERNVAKKRWLRQAMSEESGTMVSPTIETKLVPESESIAPLSPPTSPPLKKRRLTPNLNAETEFVSNSDVQLVSAVAEDPPPNIGVAEELSTTSVGVAEVPLSTTEAAQLLTFMQHQSVAPTPDESATSGETDSPENQIVPPTPAEDCTPIVSEITVDRPGTPVQDELDQPLTVVEPTPPYAPIIQYADAEEKQDAGSVWEKMAPLKSSLKSSPTFAQPVKAKKVKISLDEYKKRKSTVSTEGPDPQASVEPAAEERSRDSPESSASAPASAPVTASQRTSSFIPQINEGELVNKSIRLGTIPDPRLIGKTSTTLDELRQRIYGRSYSSAPALAKKDAQEQAVEVLPTSSSAVEQSSVEQRSAEVQQIPQENADIEPEVVAPSHHRMSLMERLRMEFGL